MNNASATFLLRFKGEFSQLQAGIKSISALAKTEAAKAAGSVGTPVNQRVSNLASDKGSFVGDVRAAQQAGVLNKGQADAWVNSIGRAYGVEFRNILREAGISKGSAGYAEAQKQYKTTTADSVTRQVKEHAASVAAVKEENKASKRKTKATNEAAVAAEEETKATKEAASKKKKASSDSAKASANVVAADSDAAKASKESASKKRKTPQIDEIFGGTDKELSPKEAAKQAVKRRKTAVEYGYEEQKAYLGQIESDPAFASQLAGEKALRDKRLAIERQNYNKYLFDDFNTSGSGQSIIEKSAEAKAGEKRLSAIQDAGVNTRLAADKSYIDATVASSVAQRKLSAIVSERLVADSSLQQALIRSASVEREAAAVRKAAVERYLADSTVFNKAQAQTKISQYNQKTAQAQEFIGAGGVQAAGKAKAIEASIQSQINAAKFEELSVNQTAIKAKARSIVAENRYKAALEAEVAQLTGSTNPNTPKRRFLGWMGGKGGSGFGGGGGGGFGDESAGEFFGAGLRTTLRYAVPSMALFAAAGTITETIKQASELERIFNQIEAQFTAVDDAASFPQFKQSILDISRESGVASDILATIAFQFKGAFGDQGNRFVEQQIRSATQISKVTGLDPAEIVDSITAASKSFDVDAQSIGNVALDLQDRYGVLAKETIKFLGDVAPAAADAKFELEEIATYAAIAQQQSGRSGGALAESFGRVLPAMRDAKGELLSLSATNDALKSPEFMESLVKGDVAEQFTFLAENFASLDENAKGFVISLLGGRREAQAILPIFMQGSKLRQEIDETRGADPNLLDTRFQDLQETLTQQLSRVGESFRQFGVDLYESGLGDFLKDMVGIGGVFIDFLSTVAKLFLTVNKATAGLPGKLASIYAIFKLIQALSASKMGAAMMGSSAIAGFSPFGAFKPAYQASLASSAYSTVGASSTALLPGIAARGQAIGAGLAATMASPAFLATGAVVAGALYYQQRQQAQAEQQSIVESYKNKEAEDLQNIISNDGLSRNKVSSFIFGSKSYAEIALDELQARGAESGIQQVDYLRENLTGKQKKELADKLGMDSVDLDALYKDYKNNPTDDGVNNAFNKVNEAILGAGIDDPNSILDTKKYKEYLEFFSSSGSSKSSEVKKIIDDTEATYKSLDQLKAGYEAGTVGMGEIKENLDGRIQAMQEGLKIDPNDEQLNTLLAQYTKDRNAIVSDAINKDFDIEMAINDLKGFDSVSQATLSRIGSLTRKLNTSGYDDPTERSKTSNEILSEYKNLYNQRLQSPDLTLNELNRMKQEGYAVPEEVQQQLVSDQLDSSVTFQGIINSYEGNTGGKALKRDDITEQIKVAIAAGSEAKAALAQELKAEQDRLLELLQDPDLTDKQREKLESDAYALMYLMDYLNYGSENDISFLETIKGSDEDNKKAAKALETAKLNAFKAQNSGNPVAVALADLEAANKAVEEAVPDSIAYWEGIAAQAKAEKDLIDANSAIADSKDAYAKALVAGDPLAVANISIAAAMRKISEAQSKGDVAGINAANTELVQAQRARRDYYISLAEAQADLDLAMVENDPIDAAKAAISAAERQYANAENAIDRLKAEAAKIRANRQLAAAQQDIANAQIDLMQAWADFAGDTVLSADLALQRAKENLAYLKKSGAGEAEIKRAQAAVVQAQGQLRDSQLQDRLDTYNFMYEMDQISKGQLITYLQSLLKIPNLTEAQVRDIQLQIKQLRDDLGDSFNVPSELNLPTLYEVTRLDQLNGQSYQSARQLGGSTGAMVNNNQSYEINIYAYNSLDADKALEQVKTVVSGPNRSGYDPRLF